MPAHRPAFRADPDRYRYGPGELRRHWSALHAGDAEALPADDALLHGWALLHAGEFEAAAQAGLALGPQGLTLANAAQALQADWLEPSEPRRRQLRHAVALRARAQQQAEPRQPGAWYWQAHALGRCGQGMNLAQALGCGLGAQVQQALQRTIELAPAHADAWLALGVFHAELLDQLGDKLAATLGAGRRAGLAAFERALALHPRSALVRLEYAHGLLRLEGEAAAARAEALLAQAADCEALDAAGHLAVERARAELSD